MSVSELDGWLVWSTSNIARLYTDEQHDEARKVAFEVLGALYKVEMVENFGRAPMADTDSEPEQGQNKSEKARLRDPAVTGPDAMVLPGATPRPRSSGTDVNTGAGRASMSSLGALAQLRALCETDDPYATLFVDEVRAVLDAVSVDATLAQGPVRDALLRLLDEDFGHSEDQEFYGSLADRILALVRSVEGIVLSPEEAALAAETVRHVATAPPGFYSGDKQARARALLARLEVAHE